ncbi:unnamed protein product [Thlaspi arvense]|uniref:Uncharacterized protein n=1 Tax=Thlaspi arvense TaxID=13288 RepID=A0AAU9SR45_THLAR|nr:unnamed protein product [Thlaspi arvense]
MPGSIGRRVALDQTSGGIDMWIVMGLSSTRWRHLDHLVRLSILYILRPQFCFLAFNEQMRQGEIWDVQLFLLLLLITLLSNLED